MTWISYNLHYKVVYSIAGMTSCLVKMLILLVTLDITCVYKKIILQSLKMIIIYVSEISLNISLKIVDLNENF